MLKTNILKKIDSPTDEDYLKNNTPNSKVLTYNQLTNYKDIDALFGDKNIIYLLYESIKNYGHWCLLMKRKNGNIEFFDSYGIFPDQELKFSNKLFRIKNNMTLPHLTALLYKCPYHIEYNNYKLQSKNNNVATCGKWCLIRALSKDICNIDIFADYFKNNKHFKPDELIVLFTK